jgi:hypothetical protein
MPDVLERLRDANPVPSCPPPPIEPVWRRIESEPESERPAGRSRTERAQRRRRLPSAGTLTAALSAVAALAIGAAAVVLLAHRGTGPEPSTTRALGTPSAPLSGRIPGRPEPGSMQGDRYAIVVTPFLTGGELGWNTTVMLTSPAGRRVDDNPFVAFNAYASQGISVFAGNTGLFNPVFKRGAAFYYVLTSSEVASIRVGSRTIRTFGSPLLPAGDRAAVFFLPARTLVIHGAGSVSVPPPFREATLVALGRDGRPIRPRGRNVIEPSPSFWQAANVTGARRGSWPTHPSAGVCQLSVRGLPGWTAGWGDTAASLVPATNAVDGVLASCVSTEYQHGGSSVLVAVLLNGRRPGARPGPIPGAVPVVGEPDLVDAEAAHLTAKRTGNAWLVAQGGTGEAMRAKILAHATVSRIDLGRVHR